MEDEPCSAAAAIDAVVRGANRVQIAAYCDLSISMIEKGEVLLANAKAVEGRVWESVVEVDASGVDGSIADTIDQLARAKMKALYAKKRELEAVTLRSRFILMCRLSALYAVAYDSDVVSERNRKAREGTVGPKDFGIDVWQDFSSLAETRPTENTLLRHTGSAVPALLERAAAYTDEQEARLLGVRARLLREAEAVERGRLFYEEVGLYDGANDKARARVLGGLRTVQACRSMYASEIAMACSSLESRAAREGAEPGTVTALEAARRGYETQAQLAYHDAVRLYQEARDFMSDGNGNFLGY